MKKIIIIFFASFLFADINIAVASNAYNVTKKIADVFYKKYHIKSHLIIGSSGKLTMQILHNAPYDVFLSADTFHPDIIAKKLHKKTKVYAIGELVLYSTHKISSLKDILKAQKIAIANPKTAPYGKAAIEVLKNTHLLNKVKSKLIIAPNVKVAFNYAKITGYAFVAKSLVSKNYITINPKLYSPIKQSAILISNNPQAKKFFEFIFSKQAKEIFKSYGYRF